MSRAIHRAPLAVTSDGRVILNVCELGGPLDSRRLLERALRTRGALFLGVVLTSHEVDGLVHEAALLLPNITGPLGAGRRRG